MKSNVFRTFSLLICLSFMLVLFACNNDEEEPIETFMVTFSRNIENVTISGMPSPQNVEEGSLVIKPTNNPTSENYEFIGWYEDSLGTIPFDFDHKEVTSRLTIYAKWELKVVEVLVTFDLNYDASPDPITITIASGETIDSPETPSRDGYIFKHWSTEPDADYIYNFSNSIETDLELYAIWEQLFTLTYIYNIDDQNPESETYSASELTVRPSDPTRSNFAFNGWFLDGDFNTPYVHETFLTKDTTIYAKWTRTSYKVTFDLNYDDTEAIIINANIGADVPTPATPTRDGFIFDQWYVSPTERSEAYLFDFSPVSNDDTVVYAGWKQIYTVTFDLNYEEALDPIEQEVIEEEEISVFTPSREDYNFGGWYIDPECTISYEYDLVTSNFTLYAKWIEVSQETEQFEVTFDLDFEGSEPIKVLVFEGSVATRPEDPTREGYRFMGWVTSPSGSTMYRFPVVTEAVTVYARWANLWNITFDLNYENAPESLVIETLDNTRISKPEDPTRDGLWQFVTWQKEDGTPFVFTTIIKQDYVLRAVWEKAGYEITWDFNYQDAPNPVTTEVLIGSLIREPQKPDREGTWAISGWYLDKAFTQPFSLTEPITNDLTVYAKWASGYAYRIDLNYVNAPSLPTQILSEGSTIPNKPTNPIRANYTFAGWSTTPSGDPDFNGFGNLIEDDLTIYAQWQHTYIFEAEYVDLAGKTGAGWSGGAVGTAMIVKDTITEDPNLGTNANASNGYYLSYLYAYGLYIDFEITSDRATDAILILRLSAEQKDPFVITDDEYLITVNDQKVNYGVITIFGAYAALQQRKLPFEDVVSIPIQLEEGLNVIRLRTNNQNSMGGTMDSTAPLLDCIKLDTVANLSWNPILSNLDLFN